jgi:hypothetical protein
VKRREGDHLRLALLLALAALPAGARELPPVPLTCRIELHLDPVTRAFSGKEEVRLRNDSASALDLVPLHLYLNAFAHPRTTWMLEADAADVLATQADPWGFVEPRRIVQHGLGGDHDVQAAAIQPDDGNGQDRTLVQVVLAEAVQPGEDLVLRIDFEGRLPAAFARTGAAPDFVVAAEFFPKIAALVDGSFRAHQFHAATEFFADFGDYDLVVDAPSGWQLTATGRPVPAPDGRRAFHAAAVHDVVIALAPVLSTETFVVTPEGQDPVEVRLVGAPTAAPVFPRARRAVTFALEFLAAHYAPYPWDSLTVVLPPWAARRLGGMEYPGVVLGPFGDPLWDLGPARGVLYPEAVLVHEVAHQWFQGLVASDEVEAAFLDEGLATYAELRMMDELSPGASLGSILGYPAEDDARRRLKLLRTPLRESLAGRPSFLYEPGTWDAQVYARMALTLRTAERLFGTAAVDRLLRDHVRAGSFRHPDLRDLLTVASLQPGVTGLLSFLEEALERPDVPDYRVASVGSVPARRRGGDGAASFTAEVSSEGDAASSRSQLQVEHEGTGGEASDVDVLVEGPGWRNLPVIVELTFADGTVLRDRWDGRSSWRRYRFLAPAALVRAQVDATEAIALDPDRANDVRAVVPHPGFVTDLAGFVAQAVALLVAGGAP